MKRSLFLRNTAKILTLIFIISAQSLLANDKKISITTSSEEAKKNFLQGRDLFEKLEQQESIKYFAAAIEKDKNFALAYYYHALTNPTAKGFFEDLDKAVELSGQVSDGEKLLILSLQEGVNGNSKQQEVYLKKLVNLFPDDERAHNQVGQFYFGQQKYDLTIKHLKKSTEIAPDFSAAYNMLGYSYKNLEKYSDAEKSFKKYIQLIPDDPNPYDSYAELLMKEGKYEESIEQYQKALSVDRNFIPSYIGIATNYNFMGNHEEARKHLQKFYDMARNDGEKRAALFAMVVSYVDEGNTEKALEVMNKELAVAEKINDHANMSADLNAIGNILFEAGRYDEAAKAFEESLRISEESNLAEEVKTLTQNLNLYNSARIDLMKNDLKSAKEKSGKFTSRVKEINNTFQIWLSHELEGQIALTEKNYKKAEEEFKKGNMQNPYNYYRLALAYDGQNEKELAKKYFSIAADFNSLNNINQSFIRQKARKMVASM
jgi:tetratricopeptide (TPR) repeat protein